MVGWLPDNPVIDSLHDIILKCATGKDIHHSCVVFFSTQKRFQNCPELWGGGGETDRLPLFPSTSFFFVQDTSVSIPGIYELCFFHLNASTFIRDSHSYSFQTRTSHFPWCIEEQQVSSFPKTSLDNSIPKRLRLRTKQQTIIIYSRKMYLKAFWVIGSKQFPFFQRIMLVNCSEHCMLAKTRELILMSRFNIFPSAAH